LVVPLCGGCGAGGLKVIGGSNGGGAGCGCGEGAGVGDGPGWLCGGCGWGCGFGRFATGPGGDSGCGSEATPTSGGGGGPGSAGEARPISAGGGGEAGRGSSTSRSGVLVGVDEQAAAGNPLSLFSASISALFSASDNKRNFPPLNSSQSLLKPSI
jgi:hypothetical protein